MNHSHKVPVLTALTAALVVYAAVSCAQETPVPEGFIGRGMARITSADVETARQQALSDAQGKAVMEAVSALVSLETMGSSFPALKKTFFNKSTTYIQSFKILYENTAFDTYQIIIQALVQQELIKQDLDALFMGNAPKMLFKVLLMIAEKSPAAKEYSYWWSAAPAVPESELRLKDRCTEKGFTVLDPSVGVKEFPPAGFAQSLEPDLDSLCRLGAQCGADLVIVGRTDLERSKITESSSFSAFQCNFKAQTVSVKDHKVLVSAAGYGLGVNADETLACRNAIDKASRQILEQIVDKLQMLPR
ncbi:MAG: hypothetical protein NTY29_03270 [Proteobacteria bacterium]|nr:hypothetical protein [Pseudomonadota bacterium]